MSYDDEIIRCMHCGTQIAAFKWNEPEVFQHMGSEFACLECGQVHTMSYGAYLEVVRDPCPECGNDKPHVCHVS